MIKHVMFDMDGLLIDSERYMWVPNELKAFASFGLEGDVDFLMSLMGGSRATSSKRFLEKYGDDFPIDEFYDRVALFNAESIKRGEVPLKDGARELIAFLKENNITFSLGTSSAKDYVTNVLKANNIYEEFKIIVTVDDVKVSKPEPDIYLKCLEKSGVEADEAIVLEDAHNGALAAYRAGCRCIIVPDLGILFDWDKEHCVFCDRLLDVIDIIKKENNIK